MTRSEAHGIESRAGNDTIYGGDVDVVLVRQTISYKPSRDSENAKWDNASSAANLRGNGRCKELAANEKTSAPGDRGAPVPQKPSESLARQGGVGGKRTRFLQDLG